MASDERDAWRSYPETILSFEGGTRVDLRSDFAARDRAAVERLGLGPRFAVLTAGNPRGEEPGDEASVEERDAWERENVRRILRLEEALTLRRVPYRRLVASSPDGLHRERCVAVALPRREAEALARDREQLALFWYDGERFWLWPAEAAAPPEPLPAV